MTDQHRGAFGEYGGESAGFIDRAFRERIVLAGVTIPPFTDDDTQAGLDELEQLVDTAGADVMDRVVQRRQAPDPATYIGTGKAEELRLAAEAADCDTVVFDDELSPAQQHKLEKLLGRTAIDRTAVILDIFGQNASSQEGKAQVELAQLRYRLPRIRGKGKDLSQQRGGIGARQGGGETKLEIDRRRIVRRIHKLEADLKQNAAHRDTQRKQRNRSRTQQVTIVGYTNAGKSTLLNTLTDSGVLVEAFRSTLQVAVDADLLVHVVDASAADPQGQIDAVHAVLREIGADDVPELLCFNKTDRTTEGPYLLERHEGSVAISALTGAGIDGLLVAIGDRLRALTDVVELLVPYDRGDVLAEIHREGEVLSEAADADGMRVRARLDGAGKARLQSWQAETPQPAR